MNAIGEGFFEIVVQARLDFECMLSRKMQVESEKVGSMFGRMLKHPSPQICVTAADVHDIAPSVK